VRSYCPRLSPLNSPGLLVPTAALAGGRGPEAAHDYPFKIQSFSLLKETTWTDGKYAGEPAVSASRQARGAR
jgi:hypothetical protein